MRMLEIDCLSVRYVCLMYDLLIREVLKEFVMYEALCVCVCVWYVKNVSCWQQRSQNREDFVESGR